VKHSVAENYLREAIGKRHLLDRSHLEVFRGQSGLERCGQLADVLHAFGILVECKYFTACAQQIDEVATITASGVQHTHAWRNVPAQNLIEYVDIDLAELVLDA
jgi:hypothetical protein